MKNRTETITSSIYNMIRRLLICSSMILVLIGLAACWPRQSLTAVPISQWLDSSLIGVWQADYSFHGGVDILVFYKDGTYQQIYEDTQGYLYSSDLRNWHVEHTPTGRVFVHLTGGLWFPEGPDIANLKGADAYQPNTPHGFYDPITNSGITMSNELILEVAPRANARGFVLMQFAYGIDSGQDHFEPAIK